MNANPMPLRRAVEIVEAGEPREVVIQDMGARIVVEPDRTAVALYTRARLILAAAVEAHEARCALSDERCVRPLEMEASLEHRVRLDSLELRDAGALLDLRKLERGE